MYCTRPVSRKSLSGPHGMLATIEARYHDTVKKFSCKWADKCPDCSADKSSRHATGLSGELRHSDSSSPLENLGSGIHRWHYTGTYIPTSVYFPGQKVYTLPHREACC